MKRGARRFGFFHRRLGLFGGQGLHGLEVGDSAGRASHHQRGDHVLQIVALEHDEEVVFAGGDIVLQHFGADRFGQTGHGLRPIFRVVDHAFHRGLRVVPLRDVNSHGVLLIRSSMNRNRTRTRTSAPIGLNVSARSSRLHASSRRNAV